MDPKDITKEEWREYDFCDHVYRIDAPQTLWIGSTTHRILDSKGVIHCLPAPGQFGCVLRWKPKDSADPVQF